MNGNNPITHRTKVVPSESKSLVYEAIIMLAHTNLQEVQEERTERRWKSINHSSIQFWVSLILSPYFPKDEFCLGRLLSKEYSAFHVYEDISLREIDPHRQNSLMLPVEKVYARHLSQEKFRRGHLNKKGILWDEYPLRLFLINLSNMHTISNFLILFLHAEYSLRECKNKIGKKSGFTFLSLNFSYLVNFNILKSIFLVKI